MRELCQEQWSSSNGDKEDVSHCQCVKSAFKENLRRIMLQNLSETARGQKAVKGCANFSVFLDYVEVAFRNDSRGREPLT